MGSRFKQGPPSPEDQKMSGKSVKAAGIVFAYAGLSRHGTWLEALFWLATAVAVFGVSHLVYLYLEIPLIKLARRWFPSKARIASQTA